MTCAEARAFEAQWFHGDPEREWDAMQRAGQALAAKIAADILEAGNMPPIPSLLVLCGKGHNGGDACLAAAELLRGHGWLEADVVLADPETELRPLAKRALDSLRSLAAGRRSVRVHTNGYLPYHHWHLLLDGLTGMGFKPPLAPHYASLLARAGSIPSKCLRAAVDLPSGLGDAGADPACLPADFTYATGIAKAPLFASATRTLCGRVRWLDLGFPLPSRDPQGAPQTGDGAPVLIARNALADIAGLRRAWSDKRAFGHVAIVAGSRDMPGALLLCVRAALEAGAGLVTVFAPGSVHAAFAAACPEAMWTPCPETPDGHMDPKATTALVNARFPAETTLVIGPGMDARTATLPATLLASRLAAGIDDDWIIDAGATTAETAGILAERPEGLAHAILTPHPGELARMTGLEDGRDARRVIEAARAMARTTRTTLLLKGTQTRVFGTDGSETVCCHGSPVLARGGTGDLLAGVLGALAARHPDYPDEAAALGTLWMGLAAEHCARQRGQHAMRTGDILAHLAPTLRAAH